MFRPMRRAAQALPPDEAEAILARASSGVLALSGDDGYPYALPISYVYADGTFYFHSAVTGHKIDAVARCDRASFCVIAEDEIVPERLTTRYRSVIAFGRIRMLTTSEETRAALHLIAQKYAPAVDAVHTQASIEKHTPADLPPTVCVLAMTVEHLTGKEGKLLTAERSK